MESPPSPPAPRSTCSPRWTRTTPSLGGAPLELSANLALLPETDRKRRLPSSSSAGAVLLQLQVIPGA